MGQRAPDVEGLRTTSTTFVDLGFWVPSFGARFYPQVQRNLLSLSSRAEVSSLVSLSSWMHLRFASADTKLMTGVLCGVWSDFRGLLMHTHLSLQGSLASSTGLAGKVDALEAPLCS
jgi:hypothetical protein